MRFSINCIICIAGTFSLFIGARSAQGAVMTFDSLTAPKSGTFGYYGENGFVTQMLDGGTMAHWGQFSSENADPGGATLYATRPGATLVIGRNNNTAFTLNSFQLDDVFHNGDAGTVEYSATTTHGPISGTLKLNNRSASSPGSHPDVQRSRWHSNPYF